MEASLSEELDYYFSSSFSFELQMISEMIFKSKNCTILTGAGISTESGIPEFRSENGIWKKLNPSIYGNYEHFLHSPSEFWKLCEQLKSVDVFPTKAHFAVAELEKLGFVKTVITQNVDGLHQRAGNKNVIEMHGSGKKCYCTHCDFKGEAETLIWKTNPNPSSKIPKCPKCQSLLKVDLILFGEEVNKTINEKIIEITSKNDLLIILGSSLQVSPCNLIPMRAKQNGAQIVIINKEKTQFDHYADIVIHEDVNFVLPKIVEKINEMKKYNLIFEYISQFKKYCKHHLNDIISFCFPLLICMISFMISFLIRLSDNDKLKEINTNIDSYVKHDRFIDRNEDLFFKSLFQLNRNEN